MRFRPPLCNQLFANCDRKRNVRESAAVKVADLAAAGLELDAAETVRHCHHPVPARHLLCNLFPDCAADGECICAGVFGLDAHTAIVDHPRFAPFGCWAISATVLRGFTM